MKYKMINLLFGLAFILSATAAGGSESEKKEPSLFSPAPNFAFEKTVEGTEILHDFIIKNSGSETVDVQRVKSG